MTNRQIAQSAYCQFQLPDENCLKTYDFFVYSNAFHEAAITVAYDTQKCKLVISMPFSCSSPLPSVREWAGLHYWIRSNVIQFPNEFRICKIVIFRFLATWNFINCLFITTELDYYTHTHTHLVWIVIICQRTTNISNFIKSNFYSNIWLTAFNAFNESQTYIDPNFLSASNWNWEAKICALLEMYLQSTLDAS